MSDCKKNKDCGCENGLATPQPCVNIFDCPTEQCSETFDSKCIVYTGDNSLCDEDIVFDKNDSVEVALNKVVQYFCNKTSKIIEYKEVIETVDFYNVAIPERTYTYPSSQYAGLIYTNNTGSAKTFKVFAGYSTAPIGGYNQIEAALFKISGLTLTMLYELSSQAAVLNGVTYNMSTDTRNDFKHESMFYLITLQNSESVTLKFKTDSADLVSVVTQAQFMIEEV